MYGYQEGKWGGGRNREIGIDICVYILLGFPEDANGKEIIAIASPRTFSESSICISATGIASVEKAE